MQEYLRAMATYEIYKTVIVTIFVIILLSVIIIGCWIHSLWVDRVQKRHKKTNKRKNS